MSLPRIFVSHSHQDARFTQKLVNDLTHAGANVWVDRIGIDHGNFMQRIDEALGQCDWVVLVLTPNAMASDYVREEIYAALARVRQGLIRGVVPILAAPCAPDIIPPMVKALQRYDATRRYKAALAEVLRTVGLSVSSVDDLLATAEVLVDSDKFEDALLVLERATRMAPDNLDAWYNLAFVQFMVGQWQDALTSADRALSIKPDFSYSWNLKGIALSALG